jgi:diguanylate cyclase (GGDEF)-like protein/PAS domain S-box-containing protein
VHEAVLLAKLLPNPGGEPKRFFDIAFPYRSSDGHILGIFGTHLSWQWASDVERSVLRPLAERKAVDTLILSKEGVVLLGPKAYADKHLNQQSIAHAKRDNTGTIIETWPDGKTYVVGYSQSVGYDAYPGLGWMVVVRQPLEDAYRPVNDLRNQILWAGVVAASLISLIVWAFAKAITKPLETLTKQADLLREDHTKEILPVRSRLTEVQILERALSALLRNLLTNERGLRELNVTLETRVEQRTKELHTAVEETRKGELRVKAIIDTALDAFVGVNSEGRITDWNPKAQEIFGWTRDEVLGRTVTETIVPPRYREAHEAGMKRYSIAGSNGVVGHRLQLAAIRRSGEEFPVEMTIGLIDAGDMHFFGTFIQDISVRKRIEDDLARERELLNVVVDSIDVGIMVCSEGGEVTMFNRVASEIHGLPAEAVGLKQWVPCYDLFQANEQTTMAPEQTPMVRALQGEVVENAELTIKPTGGTPRILLSSARPLHAPDGESIGAVIALKDVTALKESTRRLEASERSLRMITNNLPVLIGYIDNDERYQFANATYGQWFDLPLDGIVGNTVKDVMGAGFYLEHQALLARNRRGETVQFEMQIPYQGGARTVEVTRIPDIHDGNFNGVYVLGADITAIRQHEEELSKLARIDTLTGLPNRRAYQERLEAAVQRPQRTGKGLALMYLDVDHFKQVNDTLGHAAGDVVLTEVARRVKGAVRVTDTVCRLAGDEFTVILEGLKSPQEASLVAEKILRAFEQSFVLEHGERAVSASVGVPYTEIFPTSIIELGAEADKALYKAKCRGRRCFALSEITSDHMNV